MQREQLNINPCLIAGLVAEHPAPPVLTALYAGLSARGALGTALL